jgi:hypothetical protein
MTVNQQIKEMSLKEKLITMEALWDVLCHEEQEIDSPKWHGDILSARTKIMESGKAEYLTIEELKKIK